MPDATRLLGLLILVIGLVLRLRPTVVVVAAAVVTGLLSGMPMYAPEVAAAGAPPTEGILNMLGRTFADNRLVSLFIVTLPAIALSERFGLQDRAAALIRRVHSATAGRLQIVYQLFRVLVGALGIRLNGHAAFVRPIVYPMSLGAAAATSGVEHPADLDEKRVEQIKASDAAAENYGNFYGQNLSPVQPGILLVYGALKGLGYELSLLRMIWFSIPIVIGSVIFGAVQFLLFDRRSRHR